MERPFSFTTPPTRRDAIALSAALALASSGCAGLPLVGSKPLIKPPRLRHNDVVGLIAPSGLLSEAQLATRINNLQSMGLRVKLGRHVLARWGQYAGTVEQRIEDLHAMFADDDVRCIWAARGGSGATALLPHIDYGLVARKPKILIGYSDITALHIALYHRAGLVTFHGPTAGSRFTPYNVEHLRGVLMADSTGHVFGHAEENLAKAPADDAFLPRVHREGKARGALLGGNLSGWAAMLGTPYAPAVDGHLLFLEDVEEAPYRIDRLLHQLQQSNRSGRSALSDASGVLWGVCSRCINKPEPGVAQDAATLKLQDVLSQHLDKLVVPAVSGFSLGHIPFQMTLPLGIQAELDTAKGSLRLLESATVSG